MSDRETYWRAMMEQWRASGLKRAEFCRRYEINYYSMSNWVRRLASRAPARAKRDRRPAFVEVSVAGSPRPRRSLYEIVLSRGRVVRVADEFDSESLTRLIRAIESC